VPAAAVIPAPIAYINVVAVKKLVVGFINDIMRKIKIKLNVLIHTIYSFSHFVSNF